MTSTVRSQPVTSTGLRRVTGDLVLRALRDNSGSMSATELMTHTGLSRNAVHDVCADLLRLGLIEETPARAESSGSPVVSRRTGPGRPPRYYTYAASAGAVIAVDLGVHNVSMRLTDLRGDLRYAVGRHLDDPTAVDRARLLDELVDEALAGAGVSPTRVLVATVGVPMAISSSSTIHYPDHQRVIDVAQRWAEARGWPVLVENDANLAALGERRAGAARGVENVVVLLAGERLGAGIIADGRLVRGENASAGELRFVALMPDVQPEYLGAALHTRQLAERALDEGYATPGLRQAIDANGGRVTAAAVFRAAEVGDESAAAVVQTVCVRLAQLIGVLATLLNPSQVVISGGIADVGQLLASTTQQHLPTWMIDNPPTIAVSPLGSSAVLAGGVTLALEYVEAHQLTD